MTTLLLIEDNMPLRENLSEMLTLDGYSPREVEVLLWVAQGKGNHEIAAILELSVATVKKHTIHIFEKLGVESR